MQNVNPLTGTKPDYSPTKTKRIVTKHNASKKGFKHAHNLSKGQLNHQAHLSKFAVVKSFPMPFQNQIIALK